MFFIFQIGAFFTELAQQLIPVGLDIGKQFINRELQRGTVQAQKDLIRAQAQGGGISPPSFTSTKNTGALSAPFSTSIPITPAGFLPQAPPRIFPPELGPFPLNGPQMIPLAPTGLNGTGHPRMIPGPQQFAPTGRFVLDKTNGCLRPAFPGEKGTKYRLTPQGEYVKVKPRRMNALNPRAAHRASRRIDAALRAVKEIVNVSNRKDKGVSAAGGKVVRFKTRRKRRKCS